MTSLEKLLKALEESSTPEPERIPDPEEEQRILTEWNNKKRIEQEAKDKAFRIKEEKRLATNEKARERREQLKWDKAETEKFIKEQDKREKAKVKEPIPEQIETKEIIPEPAESETISFSKEPIPEQTIKADNIIVNYSRENKVVEKRSIPKSEFVRKLKLLGSYETTIGLIEVFGAVEVTLQMEELEQRYLQYENGLQTYKAKDRELKAA